jgi:predicted RNA-binding protein YlxR (DUF448 family)
VHRLTFCDLLFGDETMTIDEQERAAYMAGDIERAQLLARIDALQRALGQAVADIEELTEQLEARHA